MARRLLPLLILLAAWGCTSPSQPRHTSRMDIESLMVVADRLQHTNLDTALTLARTAYELSVDFENEIGLAKSNLLMGRLYFEIGGLDEATKHLREALAHYLSIGDVRGQSEASILLANVYMRSENYEQAADYLFRALTQFDQSENTKGLAEAYGSLGHMHEKSQQYDSAVWYQRLALSFYEELSDTLGLAEIHDNIGSIFEDQAEISGLTNDARYEEALRHFQMALVLNRAIKNDPGAIVNLNNIGDVFRKQNQLNQATSYTKEALALAEHAKLDYQIKSACRDLSKIYFMRGQVDTAFLYLERSYELTDELFSTQIAEEIARTESIYALEQQRQRIALLEKDKQFNTTLLNLSSVAGVIFFVLSGFIFYQQRSKESKKRKLLEAEAELAKAELVNAQLNEQRLKAELENNMLKEDQLKRELDSKSKSLTKSTLQMIQKNEFLSGLRTKIRSIKQGDDAAVNRKIKKLAKSIDFNFVMDGEWQEFETVFQEVHSDFFKALKQRYPDLTSSEVRLCAMIRLNLPSKEMAAVMGISQDSLRVARYRLRKRLEVPKGSNLYSFITNIY